LRAFNDFSTFFMPRQLAAMRESDVDLARDARARADAADELLAAAAEAEADALGAARPDSHAAAQVSENRQGLLAAAARIDAATEQARAAAARAPAPETHFAPPADAAAGAPPASADARGQTRVLQASQRGTTADERAALLGAAGGAAASGDGGGSGRGSRGASALRAALAEDEAARLTATAKTLRGELVALDALSALVGRDGARLRAAHSEHTAYAGDAAEGAARAAA
jgi:hypothetical protein